MIDREREIKESPLPQVFNFLFRKHIFMKKQRENEMRLFSFFFISSSESTYIMYLERERERWMDELGFYVPSTVFQLFREDGRVNMKGSVQ